MFEYKFMIIKGLNLLPPAPQNLLNKNVHFFQMPILQMN